MIYNVGIDISKYKHDFCIISNTGEIIIEISSFENNKKGFQEFLTYLKSYNKDNVRIAFEATGHYSTNLEYFLINNGYTYKKYNARLIKEFINSNSLRKTKTDKADALAITRKLMSDQYNPSSKVLYHTFSLKSLCRTRMFLVKERTKVMNDITALLDITFPELKPFFNNRISETMIYILEKYKNINHIANMRDFDSIRKVSHGRFTYPSFAKLKQLAKSSIGVYHPTYDVQLSSYLSLYRHLNNEVCSIDKQISIIIKELNPHMLTIPGIGDITAAIILSEYGNINDFSHSNPMVAFAGLDCSIIQSGTLEYTGKMVKHGSGYLRYAIMNAAMLVVRFNPVFYDYYLKKRSEGKCHRVALSHVSKKLIRVIYTLETRQIDFNPSLLK